MGVRTRDKVLKLIKPRAKPCRKQVFPKGFKPKPGLDRWHKILVQVLADLEPNEAVRVYAKGRRHAYHRSKQLIRHFKKAYPEIRLSVFRVYDREGRRALLIRKASEEEPEDQSSFSLGVLDGKSRSRKVQGVSRTAHKRGGVSSK